MLDPALLLRLMLYIGRAETVAEQWIVLAAVGVILIVMLFSMLLAGTLMKIMGQKVETVIIRVLGVILAALAIHFVVDGLKASF